MARDINQIVRDTVGNYNVQVIEMTAVIEAQAEKIAELEKKLRELTPDGSSDASPAV